MNRRIVIISIGFSFLVLLGLIERADGWWYYGFPRPWIYVSQGLPEIEAEEIIRRHFRSKRIPFKMNRSLRIGNRIIIPDFQLRNRVIIEYWGSEDKWYSELIERELNQELRILEDIIARDWTLPEWQKEEIFLRELDWRGIRYERRPADPNERSPIFSPLSEINIIKPNFLLNKKELYEKYQKRGKFYIIKAAIEPGLIRQELDKILEQIEKSKKP